MDQPFTDRAKKILSLAREDARALGHAVVEPAHILLGIIREGEGVAAAVLHNFRVDRDALRRQLVALLPDPASVADMPTTLTESPRTSQLLAAAAGEAVELGHSLIGTEHLLLALLRDENSLAAKVLAPEGVHRVRVRAEIRRLLGMPPAP